MYITASVLYDCYDGSFTLSQCVCTLGVDSTLVILEIRCNHELNQYNVQFPKSTSSNFHSQRHMFSGNICMRVDKIPVCSVNMDIHVQEITN